VDVGCGRNASLYRPGYHTVESVCCIDRCRAGICVKDAGSILVSYNVPVEIPYCYNLRSDVLKYR
jgi:hypothetical protein